MNDKEFEEWINKIEDDLINDLLNDEDDILGEVKRRGKLIKVAGKWGKEEGFTFEKLTNTINYLFWESVFAASWISKIIILLIGLKTPLTALLSGSYYPVTLFGSEDMEPLTIKIKTLLWMITGSVFIDISLAIRWYFNNKYSTNALWAGSDKKYNLKFRYRKKLWAVPIYSWDLPREEQNIKCIMCRKKIPLREEMYYQPVQSDAVCRRCRYDYIRRIKEIY